MPTGLRGYDMEEAHHRREYATVAAAVGGGKPIGERQFGVAVPGGVEHVGLRARMLHETGQLARSHGLLQRIQHRRKDGRC